MSARWWVLSWEFSSARPLVRTSGRRSTCVIALYTESDLICASNLNIESDVSCGLPAYTHPDILCRSNRCADRDYPCGSSTCIDLLWVNSMYKHLVSGVHCIGSMQALDCSSLACILACQLYLDNINSTPIPEYGISKVSIPTLGAHL